MRQSLRKSDKARNIYIERKRDTNREKKAREKEREKERYRPS
jgi:hypothetical protein